MDCIQYDWAAYFRSCTSDIFFRLNHQHTTMEEFYSDNKDLLVVFDGPKSYFILCFHFKVSCHKYSFL